MMHTFDGESDTVPETWLRRILIIVEYAIVVSLLLVGAVVLVHTVVTFLDGSGINFSLRVVEAIDGILVVIIVIDIAHTVFGRLHSSSFPVRPFLEIGILAGVRDILSASAHLTISGPTSQHDFYNTLISLGVGVGVVVLLLVGLLLLRLSRHPVADDHRTS